MNKIRTATKRNLQIISEPYNEPCQLDLLSYVSDYALADISLKDRQERKSLSEKSINRVPTFTYHGHIDHNKTFSSLCLGHSNKVAIEAVKRFIENDKSDFGIIYLRAESGVGKTHVLHAVANEMLLKNKSFYFSTPLMMFPLVDTFSKLQSYKFLLIDDIEEIEGNFGLQKLFCQLIDYAHSGKMKIIFTSTKNPKDLIGSDDRLKGKLLAGLIHDITRFDQELARDVIISKSVAMDISFSSDLIEIVSKNFDFNGYGLESVLHKLKSTSEITNQKITLEMAIAELKIKPLKINYETYEDLLNRVALAFQIKLEDLISPVRRKTFALARHVAMFILREKFGLSLKNISEIFANDHSTVLYAVSRIKRELARDVKIRNIVQTIIDESQLI
jgi:chromosomal replication initiator protein